MCLGCWETYGSPNIDNPGVRAAASAITALYEVEIAGGAAHIVTDDWNIESENIAYCMAYIAEDASRDEHGLALTALKALEPLSIAERASALAVVDGFVEREEDQ